LRGLAEFKAYIEDVFAAALDPDDMTRALKTFDGGTLYPVALGTGNDCVVILPDIYLLDIIHDQDPLFIFIVYKTRHSLCHIKCNNVTGIRK